MSHLKKFITSALLIAALIIGFGLYFHPWTTGLKTGPLAEIGEEFPIVRPVFASGDSITANYLQQEAGMSIWLDATANSPLNLDTAKTKMENNLENATSPDYVIGSIPLPNFPSDEYPHCLVDRSGWIIVYYLKIDIQKSATTGWIGKMIVLNDSSYYVTGNLEDNILQKGLEFMCNGLVQTPTTNARYYHFQYPDATKLMIAIKSVLTQSATATFNIQVPSSLNVSERSWSFYARFSGNLMVDTTPICSSGFIYGGVRLYGSNITSVVLSSDVLHTISVHDDDYNGNWAAVAILILYH